MSDFHFVTGTGAAGALAASAVADFNDGGCASDIVSMKQYETCYFIVHWGVATGGTATPTITVTPCDDATPTTTTTAIPFQYKRVSAGETNTAWTTSSSLLCTAGSHQVYVIKVKAQDLPSVSNVVYEYVRCDLAETTNNDPLVGGIIIAMADPRYNEDTLDAVTA